MGQLPKFNTENEDLSLDSSVSYSQSFLKCRSTKLVLQSSTSRKILSITNFTSKLLKCFVLKQSGFKIHLNPTLQTFQFMKKTTLHKNCASGSVLMIQSRTMDSMIK